MSTRGFICVGGPLNGELRAAPDGVVSFEVQEQPCSFDLPRYSAAAASEQAPVRIIKSYRYALQCHERYGWAWILQN